MADVTDRLFSKRFSGKLALLSHPFRQPRSNDCVMTKLRRKRNANTDFFNSRPGQLPRCLGAVYLRARINSALRVTRQCDWGKKVGAGGGGGEGRGQKERKEEEEQEKQEREREGVNLRECERERGREGERERGEGKRKREFRFVHCLETCLAGRRGDVEAR